jgi:hypothetical protein
VGIHIQTLHIHNNLNEYPAILTHSGFLYTSIYPFIYSTQQPTQIQSLPLSTQPPRPQRQRLNAHHRRLNEPPESQHAHNNAQDVDDVVSVGGDVADAAAVEAAVPFVLERARKGLRDEGSLEEVGFGRQGGGRAGCLGEEVDGFEDEEAREGAAEVGDAGENVSINVV